MKPIVLYVLGLSLLFSTVALAQRRTYYHQNTFDKTFSNCQYPPTFGADPLALQTYMQAKLQDQIPQTKGHIKISVLIDTLGKPVCQWIENKSNYKVKQEKLNELIDSMPNWNYGIQNGHKVNCAEIIGMTFNKKSLAVLYRMGFE